MFPVFPSAYIDNSLLTSVLVGVVVLWILAERLGWPATGLVVPGYLGAVLAVRPTVALVVLVEAVLTYILADVIGRRLPRWLPYDRAFGRDRFFLIILMSIFVRLFIEGDEVQSWVADQGLSVAEGWRSLGLVLVPLTANTFWKPGLSKGVPLVGIPVMIIYAILEYVLLPFTNLNLTQFELTYQDLGWTFLEAPREYMLLVLGAFIASHTTIRYGWDFGGIIVCGLLAISWLDPISLAATVVEIILIVLFMRAVTSVRPLRTANLSGLRPIVLAFAMSYFLKLCVAWITQGNWPGFRVGDLFGFGYLLPAIVATRCWRKGRFARIIIPALAISLFACLLGTALGVGMSFLRGEKPALAAQIEHDTPGPAAYAVTSLLLPRDRDDTQVGPELDDAIGLARLGWNYNRGHQVRVDAFDDGAVLYAGERGTLGAAWFRTGTASRLEVVVPEAAQPGLPEAAVRIARELDAEILFLNPSEQLLLASARSDTVRLELRLGDTPGLSVARQLPDSIDLGTLNRILPELALSLDLPEDLGVAAVLTLEDPQLLDLALNGAQGVVEPGRPPAWEDVGHPRVAVDGGSSSVLELATLDRGVIQPMLLAINGDPRWLELAAGHAERLGFVVSDDGEVVALSPFEDRDPPRFSFFIRRGPSKPMAIEVRAAGRHYNAVEVAESWFAQTNAYALLVHDARSDLDAEALRRAGPFAPELAILRDLSIHVPGLRVLSLDVAREDEFPGADAVISLGRPVGEYAQVPLLMKQAGALVEGAGGRAVWYDGAARRIRFYDPANPRREAVIAAGGEYVAVYLAPTYRLRYAGTGDGSPLRAILEHARIPIREGTLEEQLRGQEIDSDAFPRELELLYAFGKSKHPGALKRMARVSAARGVSLYAFTDPTDGRTWLVARRGSTRMISPIALTRPLDDETSPVPYFRKGGL